MKSKRIGVLFGGVSDEREISLKTGGAVLKALTEAGYDAVAVDAGAELPGMLLKEKIDIAFIALHGRYGEDGCVQGVCEVMGIPYTGSGVQASAVAMDKATSKKLFSFHGVSTPAFAIVTGTEKLPRLRMPVVVKPASQGSAIGVAIVRKRAELAGAVADALKFGSSVLVEEYVKGRELTVAVFDNEAWPVVEIVPKEGFYDYKAKYTKGATDFIVPARITKSAEKKVVAESVAAARALGCSGAARVDVILSEEGVPYVLEVNTVPGLTELSLLPKAAAAAGLSYTELLEKMLAGAGLGKF